MRKYFLSVALTSGNFPYSLLPGFIELARGAV